MIIKILNIIMDMTNYMIIKIFNIIEDMTNSIIFKILKPLFFLRMIIHLMKMLNIIQQVIQMNVFLVTLNVQIGTLNQ